MSWFRKRKPEPEPESAVEPFSEWAINTNLSDGSSFELSGFVFEGPSPVEVLRYVDALADGLRAAGFQAEVRITRETVSER